MNLPNNIQAERAFLSLLLKNPEFVRQYEGIVRADDFYRRSNGLIYESMARLLHSEKPIELISIVEDMKGKDTLHDAGGIAELTSIQNCADDLPLGKDSFHVKGYAEIILDCSRRREGYRVFVAAAERAASGEELDSLLAMAQSTFQSAANTLEEPLAGGDRLAVEWTEWFAVTKMRGDCPGIPTGFPLLDYITGGWQPSSLIILGARPNMGKTALALNFATRACKNGKAVAFFSLEMTKRELVSRIIAAEGNVDARHANIPSLMTAEEEKAIEPVFEKLRSWRLFIDDSYSLPVSQIAARSRRLQNSTGLDLIIIDHLNYIGSDGKAENRTNEMRKITAALKGLAKELDIPVICLSQLSRGLESRPDKRPALSDLRESGTIEQDADIVLFLYRDGYYTQDKGDKSAELRIAKHRGGEVGTISLYFKGEYQRFKQSDFSGRTTKATGRDIPV